jgi:hypothetical protein
MDKLFERWDYKVPLHKKLTRLRPDAFMVRAGMGSVPTDGLLACVAS